MEFPRQEYWSRLPFPSPGDLPDPGIKSACPALADSLPLSQPGSPSKQIDKQINTIFSDDDKFNEGYRVD